MWKGKACAFFFFRFLFFSSPFFPLLIEEQNLPKYLVIGYIYVGRRFILTHGAYKTERQRAKAFSLPVFFSLCHYGSEEAGSLASNHSLSHELGSE